MKIEKKVSQFIDKHQLLTLKEKVIVGLSGGSDSVALLHILLSLGYNCIAAHCNFHLRGEESLRDEDFVRKLCTNRQIPLEIISFDTQHYAEENHVSIEMAARELRYAWFNELSSKHQIQHIAIAHHQDDSVETVLLNLMRGTGIRGLKGISPKNGNIVRPLLCLSKKEITQFITENELKYVDDRTNSETVFFRNKIRLEILPLMELINPSVKGAISHMSQHLSQVEHIYNKYITEFKGKVVSNNLISISELKKSEEPEALLFEILSPYGFNCDQVYDLYKSLDAISGKTFFSTTHRLIKDRDSIIVDPIQPAQQSSYFINEDTSSIDQPFKLVIETIDNSNSFVISKTSHTLCLDKDKISFPLTLRKWQKGDWFVPFGMNGKKKVSDFFSDQKFSLKDKESAWILASKDKIVWIVGHRADNRFRISQETKKIVKIKIL